MKAGHFALVAAVACVVSSMPIAWSALAAVPTPPPAAAVAATPAAAAAAAPGKPKELSEGALKALKWLAEQQAPDGGWAQGEEAGRQNGALAEKSNVGDTCMAVLALLRSGSTPAAGPYAENIRKGIAFVASKVDASAGEGLSVTDVNGTRIQGKLGPNIDTFLAALLLGEIRNQMPDELSRKTVIASLDKVMDKIEKNQTADGRVASGGWAPGLAQGVAAKASNVAAANGADVSEQTLANFEKFSNEKQLAAASPVVPAAGAGGMGGGGAFADGAVTATGGMLVTSGSVAVAGRARAGADDAGVPLYAQASQLTSLQFAQDRLEGRKEELTQQLQAPATSPADADKLREQLKDVQTRIDNNGGNLTKATDAVRQAVNDPRFMSGFGSNGGEEYLSYLNLGETLFKKGGEDWKTWDVKMTANLTNIQNKDGSWSGQHCITSRTFCTSSALLVLMIDRETKEISANLRKR